MSIPGSLTPLFNSGGGAGYQISRSLRFNSADSAYLSRTPASAGNRKTWTWSGWVKRSRLGVRQALFAGHTGGAGNYNTIEFITGDSIVFFFNGTAGGPTTTALFRDLGAWMHVCVALDTTQATAGDRVKIYVNGVLQAIASGTYPAQNADLQINAASQHDIGVDGGYDWFNGYLADIHFIDGQALTPSSFAETNATTGQWVPKAYTGTYGTNGFRLDFSDNSAATATTLGKDRAGSNNWTPNNLSVTAGTGNDSLVDTPTSYGIDTGAGGEVRGNYSTWGAPYAGAAGLSNGNLDFLAPTTMNAFGSISVTSGKWYWEILNSGTGLSYVGIMDSTITSATDTSWSTQSRAYVSGGSKYNGSSSSYGSSWAAGDVIGFALDLDSNSLTFYKNGVSQGVAFSTGLIGKEWKPFVYGSSGSGCSANFGQRPFAYTAPSGFKALCDTNLPAPVVAKPSTVMDVKLYTGTGATQTVSGLGFSPDLVWAKNRTDAASHQLYDIVRGAGNVLYSNSTSSEEAPAGTLTAFTSDGFTLNSTAAINASTKSFVAWAWDAGSSTVTNTQGSITSQVRANASAGFSIVTYTVSAPNQTVGHGLGVAPAMSIAKRRNSSGGDWYARFKGGSFDGYLILNSTAAGVSAPNSFTSTTVPTAYLSSSNEEWVLYNFAPVAGYSAFGSYTGNNNADGPFIYTGFRPRWILIKPNYSTYPWEIYDTARSAFNVVNVTLAPNTSNSEPGQPFPGLIDVTSNGFKIRSTFANSYINTSGVDHLYVAFAESPFQYARAR